MLRYKHKELVVPWVKGVEKKMDELSFHEWLLAYHGFGSDDIEYLLSSDELEELHEEYEAWLIAQ